MHSFRPVPHAGSHVGLTRNETLSRVELWKSTGGGSNDNNVDDYDPGQMAATNPLRLYRPASASSSSPAAGPADTSKPGRCVARQPRASTQTEGRTGSLIPLFVFPFFRFFPTECSCLVRFLRLQKSTLIPRLPPSLSSPDLPRPRNC